MLKRILRSRRGEGYIDVCVLVLCAMLVIALAVQVLPAFIAKQQLDTFATELVREAEIAGRIGPETDRREQALREQTGLDPEIEWSDTGRMDEPDNSASAPRGASVLLIRRLTPLECERLQGFPDGWTDIEGASDSARYKALGNSVAIPCVDYVLQGIAWATTAQIA